MLDRETIKSVVGLQHLGVNSLYTWMRNYITRYLDGSSEELNIGFYREDGLNARFPVDGLNNLDVTTKINKVIYYIKSAASHARMLLYIKIGDNTTAYVITRLNDVEYNNGKGKKVKQMILIERVNNDYIDDFIRHFTITGMCKDIIVDPLLMSIISNHEIDNTKVEIVRDKLFPGTLPTLEKLKVYYHTLNDSELERLQVLPFTGIPCYRIDKDMRFSININGSKGNGLYFIL